MGGLFLQQHWCRIIRWLFWALLAFSSAWAENRDGSAVQVEISPTTSFALLDEVTVLPVRFADGRPAGALTEALISVLDGSMKYTLKQPLVDVRMPLPAPTADPVEAMTAASRRFAQIAHLQAVIGGVLVPDPVGQQRQVHSGGETHQLIVRLIDIGRAQPVWTLVCRLNPDEAQLFRPPLQRAIDALLSAMVQRGDIFTTRLPAPKVLSRKMVAGQVRLILQGRQQPEIVAYRLLRAETLENPFVTVSADITNNRYSLVLEDIRTPPHTPGWYIVIGINKRGLAGVPDPPVYIADDQDVMAP
jgi:hypothetical protein